MYWHGRLSGPGSKYPGVACRAGGGLARGAGGGVADPCPTCWHLAAPPRAAAAREKLLPLEVTARLPVGASLGKLCNEWHS